MKKTLTIIITLLLNFSWCHAEAQRSQRRQQRKHRKTEQKIDKLERENKLDGKEAADIDKKEDRYHRTKNRATRNGSVSGHEHRKMKRQGRRLKREVNRADD
ncbi:MAG: hypothetical protein ACKVOR_01520 [Flavobacteriales bacterium]